MKGVFPLAIFLRQAALSAARTAFGSAVLRNAAAADAAEKCGCDYQQHQTAGSAHQPIQHFLEKALLGCALNGKQSFVALNLEITAKLCKHRNVVATR